MLIFSARTIFIPLTIQKFVFFNLMQISSDMIKKFFPFILRKRKIHSPIAFTGTIRTITRHHRWARSPWIHNHPLIIFQIHFRPHVIFIFHHSQIIIFTKLNAMQRGT